ncbi:Undecaprenyl diphosphate synthase [Polychaeton citri CBS 116435]|uniref:Alkyl transferase n=1 Tax=Polychaeton citri CBS 116435 TaxID=1314669 RepID=A0A9P4QH68_9PEZI|nr:Undecaprenyl diphosphate synthase [Polychaeton citri CBS 116435]
MPSQRSYLKGWVLSLPPLDWALQQIRELVIGSLKCGPIPQHIAFVMDGNRRFARTNDIETIEGHSKGFEALARILEVCYKSGVKVVTIYAFSIENFKRSRYEVDALMDMAKTKLVQMSQHGELLDRYGASIKILGDRTMVREDVRREMEKAVDMTKHNESAVLNVCFPYTSRDEITHSIRETVKEYSQPPAGDHRPEMKRPFSESSIQRNIRSRQLAAVAEEEDSPERAKEGAQAAGGASDADSTDMSSADLNDAASSTFNPASSCTSNSPSPDLLPTLDSKYEHDRSLMSSNLPDPEGITSETLTKHMYTSEAPPLDLLVRTSGVKRLSDFMLWQCHEDTEIRFLDCLWPEFDLWRFLPVLVEWQWRQRRTQKPDEGSKTVGSTKSS